MLKRGLSIVLLSCVTGQVFASVPAVQVPNLPVLEQSMQNRAVQLIQRHKGNDIRPEACPLESKKHIDILSKITTIKALLKENCLDTDQNRIDEILSGAKSIQDELDKAAKSLASTSTDSASSMPNLSSSNVQMGGTTVNGQQIANVVGGINNIFKSRSCKSLQQNQSFLEQSASVVSDFAKVGLLVPNTYSLAVAGGGLALSSMMLILDSLLQRRFDFENTSDRQSFIKLNCAFYDVRRDIERAGLMDVATEAHRQEIATLEVTTKELEEFWTSLKKIDEAIVARIDEVREAYIQEQMSDLFALVNALPALESAGTMELKHNEQKLQYIKNVAELYLKNRDSFAAYKKRNLSGVALMDEMMLQLLRRFDHERNPVAFRQLTNTKVEEMAADVQQPLLFHARRALKQIVELREKTVAQFADVAQVNGMSYKDYLKFREGEIKRAQDSYQSAVVGLQNSTARVKRILSDDGVSSRDDGSENIVNILQGHAEIAKQIYGKFGDQFMDYTTNVSRKENRHFVRKFKKFAKDYLIHKNANGEDVLAVADPKKLGEFGVKLACQDARPFRAKWKFAEALSQQGYDFVATNGDLFHSDFRRPFLGRTGGRTGIHSFKNKFERIQMHYRSAIFAKKSIAGETVSDENKDKYFKKKYLGRSLLNVQESKKSAELLQELIEKYNCMASTSLE